MSWLAEFINDEPNEHFHGAQETSKKDMDVYIAANNAVDKNNTLDESVRVQVDKMENHKVPHKAHGQGVHTSLVVCDNKATYELDDSIDDDFVTNVGDRHGPGVDKEKGLRRKKRIMIQHDL
ncbi:hypothetical protein Tco_1242547 [Tanacetum coccineum]